MLTPKIAQASHKLISGLQSRQQQFPLSHKNIEMITCARTTITIRTVKRTFALDLDKVFMLKSYINPRPERFTLSRKRGK